MKQKRRGLRGDKNPMWNGGIRHGGDGRIFILKPEHPRSDKNGYVLRSILFSEKALGKPIPPNVKTDMNEIGIVKKRNYNAKFSSDKNSRRDACPG